MSIKVAAWNAEGRLGRIATKDRGAPEHIVSEILRIDADVLFVADAFHQPVEATIDAALERAGYRWLDVQYDDEGVSADHRQPNSRFLTKLDVINHSTTRYGGVRSLQTLTVRSTGDGELIRFIGVHLDDRSDALRHRQVDAMLADIDQCKDAVVLLGDFNAAHSDQLSARILRSRIIQTVFRVMPLSLVQSLGHRLGEMCSGIIMQRFSGHPDLREVDEKRHSTMTLKTLGLLFLPSLPIIQLDHVFVSKQLCHTGIIVEKDGGSDHRAIRTTVHVAKY